MSKYCIKLLNTNDPLPYWAGGTSIPQYAASAPWCAAQENATFFDTYQEAEVVRKQLASILRPLYELHDLHIEPKEGWEPEQTSSLYDDYDRAMGVL